MLVAIAFEIETLITYLLPCRILFQAVPIRTREVVLL